MPCEVIAAESMWEYPSGWALTGISQLVAELRENFASALLKGSNIVRFWVVHYNP